MVIGQEELSGKTRERGVSKKGGGVFEKPGNIVMSPF